VRKATDVLLIALILVGIGVGVYVVGRAVTHESDTAREKSAAQTLGAPTPTVTVTTTVSNARDTRDLQILVAKIVGAGVVALALLATVNALVRSRRRERWHR